MRVFVSARDGNVQEDGTLCKLLWLVSKFTGKGHVFAT